MVAHELVVVKSKFSTNEDHLMTFKSGTKTQTDYFLIKVSNGGCVEIAN